MKTANLDNFDAIHEEVAKVMEKELDKCGSMKIMIQGEHDKGWEQVKMRMEQLQAAKQKIQEQKRAAKEKAEIHVKELDDAVAAAEAAAAVLKEAVEKLTAEGAEKFKLEVLCALPETASNSFVVEAFPGVGDMPSLKEKKSHDADDVNQRRERKDVNPPARKPDRLDYSRFNEIGDDDRDERLQTGDVCLTHENKWTLWASRVFEHASMVANQRDKRVLVGARSDRDDVHGKGDFLREACRRQVEPLKLCQIIDQKRREEDDWKRQLKDDAVGNTSRLNEKPSDLSWVQGRHFASYEAFCVGRVESTLKKSGNEAFKAGDLAQAQADWEAGIGMILALGQLPDEAINMLCTLRNNLAQLHIKRGEWGKVKDLTDKILDKQPTNEKALYRRAQAFFAFSLWEKCEADLDVLLKHNPDNKDASLMLRQVHQKLGKAGPPPDAMACYGQDRKKFAGKAVSDIAAGLAELCPD
ncbi:FKBP62, partial [Symbiodinium necroappetens]